MSVLIEDASLEAHTQGGGRDSGKGLLLPPWPLHVLVASCNIDIADTPPTVCRFIGRGGEREAGGVGHSCTRSA
eukprot:366321-Chlamydomonas_euryale.AAC.3